MFMILAGIAIALSILGAFGIFASMMGPIGSISGSSKPLYADPIMWLSVMASIVGLGLFNYIVGPIQTVILIALIIWYMKRLFS